MRLRTSTDLRQQLRLAALSLLVNLAAPAQASDLLELFELARKNDPQLRQAMANRDAVAENRTQAFANLFLPQLTVSGDANANFQDIDVGDAGAVGAAGFFRFGSRNLQVRAVQPVWQFGRSIDLDRAESDVREAELLVAAERDDLVIRLAERYFDVLAAEDSLDVADAEKRALNRQLEQAEQRFEVGLVAITDVQEARAGYDLAVADQIQAQNDLEDALEALREVTGQYPDRVATLSEGLPLDSPEPKDIDTWTEQATGQNFRLLAALAAAESAQKEIRRQYAERAPSVDAVGSHTLSRTGGRFGATQIDSSALGVEFNWTPFQSGQIRSRGRAAEARHAEAIEVVEEQRRAVVRQTRDAFLGVLSGISRVRALEQAVRSTQTALEATQSGFEVGTRTSVDVVAAEREVSAATRDLSRARYDYLVDVLRLKSAASTLTVDDLTLVNDFLN